MEKYEDLELCVIQFESKDIVTASDCEAEVILGPVPGA